LTHATQTHHLKHTFAQRNNTARDAVDERAESPYRRSSIALACTMLFAWNAAAQAQTIPVPAAVIVSGSNLTFSQSYNGAVISQGVIQGSVTIHPVLPYPLNLGGAGVSVSGAAQVTIDPNQGTPGLVSIISDANVNESGQGSPNDALYIANGSVTIVGANSPQAVGVALTGNGLNTMGVYIPQSSQGSSTLNATNVSIVTNGPTADGIRIYGANSFATLNRSSIAANGQGSWGVLSWGGSSVMLTDTSVNSVGSGAGGIRVFNGSSATLNGNSSVTTATDGNIGVLAEAAASISTGTDPSHPGTVTVSTTGAGSHGVRISSASGNLNDLNVSTTRDATYGIQVYGTSTLTGSNVSVSTLGRQAYGIWASGSSTSTLDGATIVTQGASAYGVLSGSGATQFTATDLNVATHGASAHGVYSWEGAITNLGGGTITTDQASTYGIYVSNSGVNLMLDTHGNGTSVTTTGANAYAVRVQNGGTFSATGATLHATGAGGAGIVFEGPATLSATPGVGATPPVPALPPTTPLLPESAPPPAPAIATAEPTQPPATLSPATPADAPAVANAATSTNAAMATNAAAVVKAALASPYNLVLNDTTVISDASAALIPFGGVVNASLTGSTLTGATDALNVQARTLTSGAILPAIVTLDADHSVLNGRIRTDAVSTTNVNLTDNSTWNVNGNSNLTNLSNTNSLIDFTPSPTLANAPTSAGSYRNVTVAANYAGSNGMLALNTYLSPGGALSNQFTDRLLVQGNASGSTLIHVKDVAGSPGGLTSPSGVITNDEGISIVQVAGTSNTAAFALPGGYTVASDSPYEYRLFAYGPNSVHGPADPAQRVVSGSGGTFWDYRLQSAYVTPNGPVDPDVPGPGPAPSVEPDGELDYPISPDARPAVAPQVAAYISAPAAFLYAGMIDMDMLHRRLGEIRDDGDLGRDGGPAEMFFRAYGGDFNYSSNIGFKQFGYDISGDYSALQFGANAFRFRNDNGLWRFGFAGTVGWLNFEPEAVDGPSSSHSNIYRLSGYGTYQSRQGWYVDSILSVGWFNGAIDTNARGQAMKLQGNAYAASAEAGYPVALPYRVNIEPQIQLIGQHLSFHNSFDVDSLNVDIGSQNQLTGRLGVRVTRPFDVSSGRVTPYAAVDVLHSFTNGTNVQVSDVQFASGKMGDALQYALGVNGTTSAKLSLYGRVSYQQQIGNGGFRGWLINAGGRYLF
jgi:outer membrane autotransporter protein